eukprot:747613-Hanusia_phi.AAC.3
MSTLWTAMWPETVTLASPREAKTSKPRNQTLMAVGVCCSMLEGRMREMAGGGRVRGREKYSRTSLGKMLLGKLLGEMVACHLPSDGRGGRETSMTVCLEFEVIT